MILFTLRRVQLGCVIAMHVAAVAVVLRIMDASSHTSVGWRWLHLLAALLVSLTVERLLKTTSRRLRVQAWSAVGVGMIALLTVSLLGGWGVAAQNTRNVQALLAAGIGLAWLWQRGPVVPLLEHEALATTFRRMVGLLLVLVVFGAIPLAADTPALALDIVVFVASSLLALALTTVSTNAERDGSPRWVILVANS